MDQGVLLEDQQLKGGSSWSTSQSRLEGGGCRRFRLNHAAGPLSHCNTCCLGTRIARVPAGAVPGPSLFVWPDSVSPVGEPRFSGGFHLGGDGQF